MKQILKSVTFFLLSLSVGIGCAARPIASDFAERTALWHEVAAPSVLIRNLNGGSGSGVVIYQNNRRALVLTAAHVVGDDGATFVERGDVKYVGTVLRRDVDVDLALVETLPVWSHVARVVESEDLRAFGWASRVVIAGHPLGVEQAHITDGRITSVNDRGMLRYSAASFFGNSGGGVFTQIDGTWTLISIAQRIAGGQGVGPYPLLGRGVHPSNLINFLLEGN